MAGKLDAKKIQPRGRRHQRGGLGTRGRQPIHQLRGVLPGRPGLLRNAADHEAGRREYPGGRQLYHDRAHTDLGERNAAANRTDDSRAQRTGAVLRRPGLYHRTHRTDRRGQQLFTGHGQTVRLVYENLHRPADFIRPRGLQSRSRRADNPAHGDGKLELEHDRGGCLHRRTDRLHRPGQRCGHSCTDRHRRTLAEAEPKLQQRGRRRGAACRRPEQGEPRRHDYQL